MTEEKFVLDTLAGCIEYKSLLDVVVNAFFVRDGRYSLMSERNLYIGKFSLKDQMCLPQNLKKYYFTSVDLNIISHLKHLHYAQCIMKYRTLSNGLMM